jgi:hypothetical protein
MAKFKLISFALLWIQNLDLAILDKLLHDTLQWSKSGLSVIKHLLTIKSILTTVFNIDIV